MKTKLALIKNGMISQIRQYIIEGKQQTSNSKTYLLRTR